MNDNPLAIGLGVRRCLAVLMTITAALSVCLIVDILQKTELEYILQFDWLFIPPHLVLAFLIVFCVSFVVRMLMHRHVNGLAVTVASLLSIVMLLALSITMQNYLMMTIIFLYPPITPTVAILSLVGTIALFWPAKKPRQ